MLLEFSLSFAVGGVIGKVPYVDFSIYGHVLQLKWSFKAEHRDKVTYVKNSRGDTKIQCGGLSPDVRLHVSLVF